jgi:hypothetical protein
MTAIANGMSEKDQKTFEALLAKYNIQLPSKDEPTEDDVKRACAMRDQWDKMAKEAGFKPAFVWFKGKLGNKGHEFEITHQDPDNSSNTWKGVGNMPKWAREKLGKDWKQVRDLKPEETLKLMEPFKVQQ